MNTPSPLIPQGTIPPRGNSHLRIAVFTILAVHVLLLGALLLLGCRRTEEPIEPGPTNENFYPTWVEPTNPTPVIPTAPEPPPPTVIPSEPPADVVVAPPTEVRPPAPPVEPPPARGETPVAPPPVAPPARAAGTTHVVVKNDSFYTLAQKYHVSMAEIGRANPGVDPSRLQIGKKLNIPPPSIEKKPAEASAGAGGEAGRVHVVQSGDNLLRLARKYNTTVAKLRELNNLRTTGIKVGQKLKIPPPEPRS